MRITNETMDIILFIQLVIIFLTNIVFANDSISTNPVWLSLNSTKPDTLQGINTLIYSRHHLYAGGKFSRISSVVNNGVVRLDGNSWTLIGKVNKRADICALAMDTVGNLYAGGDLDSVDGVKVSYVAQWNSNTWTAMTNGPTRPIRTMLVDNKNVLYAGGDVFSKYYALTYTYYVTLWKWDGLTWDGKQTVELGECCTGTFCGGCASYSNMSIRAMTWTTSSGLYYAGAGSNLPTFDYPSSYFQNISALVTDSIRKKLYIAGQRVRLVRIVDGEKIYSNPEDCIRVVDLSSRDQPVNDIMLWAPYSITHSNIKSMVVDAKGNLFFGGKFDIQPGAKNIAFWDGKQIKPLGSGVKGVVNALALNDRFDTLFVGGVFDSAGNVYSPTVTAVALYTDNPVTTKGRFCAPDRTVSYKLVNRKLVFTNSLTHDECIVQSLSGKIIRRYCGISILDLNCVSPQVLIVTIQRKDQILSQDRVILQ